MKPKRLISLLVAVCMMITMLPLSAVTAFAADTSTVHEANDGDGIYKYAIRKMKTVLQPSRIFLALLIQRKPLTPISLPCLRNWMDAK